MLTAKGEFSDDKSGSLTAYIARGMRLSLVYMVLSRQWAHTPA